MSDQDEGQGQPASYAVEFTDTAQAEADAAYLSLSLYSQDFAERWYTGLFREAQRLAIFPNRCPVAPENSRFQNITLRQMLYRLGRTTYRILFYATDADGDGQEDTVRITHVRHGARRTLGEDDDKEDGRA